MKNNTLISVAIIVAGVIIAGSLSYSSNRPSGGENAIGARGEKIPTNQDALPENTVRVSVEEDPTLGDPNAPVTLIEFGDFECPFCGRFAMDTKPLLIENEIKQGKLRLVWKDFPLSIHTRAQKAHEAARCAQEQGKFWEYHDILFQNLRNLKISDLEDYASRLNLDRNSFDVCLKSEKYTALVQKGVEEGIRAGVRGTPAFLVNGTLLVGALPYQAFSNAINEALKKSN